MRALAIILGVTFLIFCDIVLNHGRAFSGLIRSLQELLRQVGVM